METEMPFDITSDRLRSLDAESIRLHEKRLACLWDQARLLAASPDFDAQFTENDAFRQQYTEITGKHSTDSEAEVFRLPEVSRSQLSALSKELSLLERVYLCRLLSRLAGYGTTPGANFPFSFHGDAEDGGTLVSYLRSYYTDAAFRRFSAVLREPKVLYADSFSAVCENVYYNRARSCILPIENNTEGNLRSFRQLIVKYDLKIVSVCDIPSSDEGMTRFALLRKNPETPPQDAKEVCFRFTLFINDAARLQDVLTAAGAFGLKLVRIDSVPVSFTDRELSYDITVCLPEKEADFPGFYCFLSLEASLFTPMGLYTHLK